ncbi:hypothetical protein KY290_007608 [Solanum tuberosum]|uniref:Reverse transcriptase Ty1/copia-type domain-containing protein n=1 Tax=Solanum tuberosum TaxID=4113 RepID=A0ABQ7W617_SOLTU|nr:hypothetical protein KY290_007608 [Solanum tuberosum]
MKLATSHHIEYRLTGIQVYLIVYVDDLIVSASASFISKLYFYPTERFRHLSYCIDAIGRSGFLPAAQAGSDRALARTAVIESGTERLHFNSINDVYFVSAKAKYITERKGDRGA